MKRLGKKRTRVLLRLAGITRGWYLGLSAADEVIARDCEERGLVEALNTSGQRCFRLTDAGRKAIGAEFKIQ